MEAYTSLVFVVFKYEIRVNLRGTEGYK